MVFVVKDLESKIEVLAKLVEAAPDTHGNLFAAVKHEVDTDPTLRERKKDPPSASRTILRLHRTLEFITLLISDLLDAAPDKSGHSIVSDAYGKTLSNHHAWLVRKAASASFYALPNRAGLVDAISADVMGTESEGSKKGKKDTIEVSPELKAAVTTVLDTLRNTHAAVEKLYTDNKLHELP